MTPMSIGANEKVAKAALDVFSESLNACLYGVVTLTPVLVDAVALNPNWYRITITRNNVIKRIKNRNNRNITTREYNQYNNISCLINPDNCGYNIVEIYEIYNPIKNYDKTVLWIIPYTQNNNGFGFDNDKYLGDFTYLNA